MTNRPTEQEVQTEINRILREQSRRQVKLEETAPSTLFENRSQTAQLELLAEA